MKKQFLIILTITCLLTSSLIYAAEALSIQITGIAGEPLKNVLERLAILQQSYGTELSVDEVHSFYQTAPDNIRKALEPFGYFKSNIENELINDKPEHWTAKFAIAPGPQLHINRIELALDGPGENDPVLQNFIAHFPLKTGAVFQSDSYEKAKDLLLQTANNQGYMKAELVQKEVRINLQNYTTVIVLHMNTGPRFYFGRITFSSSPFSENFLQRFLTFHEGEPFSSQALLKFQGKLATSRYFKQVIVTPEINETEGNKIPVKIFLTAPKSQAYNIGVGYGTFTGPRVTLSVDLRRITNSGQHLTTQVNLSRVLSGLAVKYFIPGKNPITDQYTIGANFQKFSPDNGSSTSETLTGSYVKSLEEWQTTLSLNYLLERFTVTDQPTQSSHLLYPSVIISRIHADNLINPTFGSAITLTLQGANQHIESSSSFAQGEIKGKYIFSPTEASRVILRGDLGYTVVEDLQKLPLTLRFFAGGIGSVRGYPFSSIGPGRYLEVGSVEYRHRIVGKWDGSVFYDVGTATDHFNSDFNHGVGVGIIYDSIIGPIQLYVASAVSIPGKPLRFEFSIGPEF